LLQVLLPSAQFKRWWEENGDGKPTLVASAALEEIM